MTDYQTISGRRIACQATLIGLFYAAAQYKKVPVPGKALSAGAVAALLQGVSTRARTPLGERSKVNWIADGVTLGLIAYGVSNLDVARRTKYAAGALLFGSQLAISNIKPQSINAHIDAIENKEDCERVCAVLEEISEDADVEVSPQEMIRACEAFLSKAGTFSFEYDRHNSIGRILHLLEEQGEQLGGFEKIQASMLCTEYSANYDHYQYGLIKKIREHAAANTEETAILKRWFERVGDLLEMKFECLKWGQANKGRSRFGRVSSKQGDWRQVDFSRVEKLGTFLNREGVSFTSNQHFDLYRLCFRAVNRYEGNKFSDSPLEELITAIKAYIGTLQGLEQAKAYMNYAELLYENRCGDPDLMRITIPRVREGLAPEEQLIVDQWLAGKGADIKLRWRV